MVTAAAAFESNPWTQIKEKLAGKVSAQAYQNWVVRTQFESLEAGHMRISVPDSVTKEWMEQEYAEDIRTAARELGLRLDSIAYIPRMTAAPSTESSPSAEPIFASAIGQINPKLRFDNFV